MQGGGDVVGNGTNERRTGSDQKVLTLVDRFVRYFEVKFSLSVALWFRFVQFTWSRFHQCF